MSWKLWNVGVRAEFNPENRFPETGQCVHKFAMAAGEPDTLLPAQPLRRLSLGRRLGDVQEITGDLPTDFGFAMTAHPRDADTCWVIPLSTPEEGRFMPDGHTAVWRTHDRAPRGSVRTMDCRSRMRTCRSCARRWPATRSTRWDHVRDRHGPGLAQLGRGCLVADDHRHAARVPGGRGGRHRLTMATVLLPASLIALFPGTTKRHEVAGESVAAVIDGLDVAVPGVRDRLLETTTRLRPHINVFVDGQPADLTTAVGAAAVVHVLPAVSGG